MHCQKAVGLRQQLFALDSLRYGYYLGLSLDMLAVVYITKQNYDRAIDTLRRAIRFSSVSLYTNPKYSEREIIREELDLADAFFKKHLLDSAELTLNQTQLRIERNRIVLSEAWTLPLVESFAKSKRTLIAEYLRQNNLIKAFDKSFKLHLFAPHNETAITTMAIIYLFSNEYDKAIQVFSTDNMNKKNIRDALIYFERKNILHPDYARVRAYFEI